MADSSSYHIRVCDRPSDAAALHSLIHELAVSEKQPQALKLTVAQLEHDGFNLSPPLYHAALMEHRTSTDVKPVGMAIWYHTYSTWEGKCLYLEDLCVTKAHRRVGLGTRLLKYVIGLAHNMQCARVNWTVLSWNQPAIRLYQQIGAVCPDNGTWTLMRMDRAAIAKLVENSNE